MAMQVVNLPPPGDAGSDSHYTAHLKHKTNIAELYSATIAPGNIKTASHTLVLADADPGAGVLEMNVAGANSVTIPPHGSVAFPVGTVIEVCQVGSGQTSIAAGAGVTIRPAVTALRAQWSSVSLRKRGTDEWVLSGDVA